MNLLKKIVKKIKDGFTEAQLRVKLEAYINGQVAKHHNDIVNFELWMAQAIREGNYDRAFQYFDNIKSRKEYIERLNEFKAYLLSEVKDGEDDN